ncbi:MAG: hypothetical protein JWO59_1169 [Chloroflexi bacterium]|nr:hypothetical protein [Chloroflexota bacterium]
MSLPAHRWISPEEYLAFEAKALEKHEYVDGVVYPRGDPDHPLDPAVVLGLRPEPQVAMAGSTLRHSTIKVNLTIAIGALLRNTPCRLYESDVRVRPGSAGYLYPDLLVVCGEQGDDLEIEVNNPTLVIEILSPSTEGFDRGEKFDHYAVADSLQQYVLVSTRRQGTDVFTRDDGRWVLERFAPPDHLHLASIGVDLDFAEIYHNVQWSLLLQPNDTTRDRE